MESEKKGILERSFDVHIIGSGIGAMTAAVLLAKVYNKSVCLLEQHWTAGGQTQTFERKSKYEWDVGVHYVGDLQGSNLEGQICRFIFDNQLKWRPLDNHYDRIRFKDTQFDIAQDINTYREELTAQFPNERRAIQSYFNDVCKTQQWLQREFATQLVPPFVVPVMRGINWFGQKKAQQTLETYLDQKFKSKALQNLIAARWGDYGLPPQQSSFAIHALVMGSYFNGAYYPEGGSKAIAASLLRQLRAHGGECLTNVKVNQIVTEGEQVIALDLTEHYHTPKAQPRRIEVNQLISNAGAYNTYRKLLDKPQFEQLESQPRSSSMLCLYLALNKIPADLDFKNSNYWLIPHNADDKLLSENSSYYFLNFPTMKQNRQDNHVAEILFNASPALFEQWQGTTWKKRGKDYRQLKQHLTHEMIDAVCEFYPQLRDAICYTELSTPLSMEFFTQHPGGNMYGVPFLPGRERLEYCQAKTPFKNLFLSGQDVVSLGIAGAMMGGAISAVASQGSAAFPQLQSVLTRFEKAQIESGV